MRHDVLARVAAVALSLALAACGASSGPNIKKESKEAERAEAARVHTELGQKYMQQGKLEFALEKLNKALSFDPDYANAHTVIALLYERIGDPKQAEEHYRRAAQLKPKGGKRDEAEAILRKALDRSPNNAEALFQLASVLYEKGDYFKARAFMQRFEAVGPARPESLMLGRNIELRLGNGNAASDYTRRLLQSFPESQQARALNAQNQS